MALAELPSFTHLAGLASLDATNRIMALLIGHSGVVGKEKLHALRFFSCSWVRERVPSEKFRGHRRRGVISAQAMIDTAEFEIAFIFNILFWYGHRDTGPGHSGATGLWQQLGNNP